MLVGWLALNFLPIHAVPQPQYHSVRPSESTSVSIGLAKHCSKAVPISAAEFHSRQDKLAQTLHALNATAYIAEPGADALYYANLSMSSWKLSERPLLLVITPDASDSELVKAKVSILTPKFETARARLLPIAFQDVTFLEWAEEANPYEMVKPALAEADAAGTIFVDGHARHFIVDGLQSAFPTATVKSSPTEIRQLRERKSKAELELMKCANEATVLAIRETRKKMYIGIRESETSALIEAAFKGAGLKDGGCLTLFGENAALPHGSGADRKLGVHDFALLDCGASLHGYPSDVTRTFALNDSQISAEQKRIWNAVWGAQNIAFTTAEAGVVAKRIDKAARLFLSLNGLDQYFTHRLGHGIGLEGHEDPYINGGSETVLKTGHSFSDEPGVYIEGDIGVRLEDCFYIADDGQPVYLTAGVGGVATSPWEP
ncbi:Creatinase/aminopeptidase [Cylindrobasidium torrendii FP15055 ss-10]|uniref:Creatinase/aminopeptidase n=1 Tax=Cylindrobasidium torrendii FP15055 ss-10 TaxID=1314674 RepID=A0A0D7BBE0_9AGAR|nr:Creatinase/aminopeptidase [Cylindrobasidium torrendii FP15055 ss-10]